MKQGKYYIKYNYRYKYKQIHTNEIEMVWCWPVSLMTEIHPQLSPTNIKSSDYKVLLSNTF